MSNQTTVSGAERTAGWERRVVGKVISEITSGDWGDEHETDGLVPAYAIRGTDFDRARRGIFSTVPVRFLRRTSLDRRKVATGDLLVEMSGGSTEQPTGRILLAPALSAGDLPVSFSNFVKRLRVESATVDPAFFAYYWEHLYRSGRTRTYEKRTTGIRNFKLDDFLANEHILIPPQKEQHDIASVLRTAQNAHAATEKVSAAARQLKRALARHLFSYGPVPVAETGSVGLKETEIGLLPAAWAVRQVGDLGEVVTGTTPRTANRGFYGGPHPFIAPGDIGEPKYVRSTGKSLTDEGLRVSRPLPKDTVLMVCIGATIGKTAMTFADGSATNQQINAVTANGEIANPQFLYYALSARASELPRLAGRAAIPIVNKSVFSQFLVPCPSLPEQLEIVHILSAVDRKIESEEAKGDSVREAFDALLPELTTGHRRLAEIA